MSNESQSALTERVASLEAELAALRRHLGLKPTDKFADAKTIRPRVRDLLMIDDKGKHRAELFISPEGGACLHLCDTEGRPRIGLSAEMEARPIIVILGPDGIARGQFGMDDNSGFLQLSTDGDDAELSLHIHEKNGACIALNDANGTPHARIQSSPDGGELRLMRRDGTAMGGFTNGKHGPLFVACDKTGEPHALFGSSPRGGFFSLSNESGAPVVSIMSIGQEGMIQLGKPGGGPGITMTNANGGPILTLHSDTKKDGVTFIANDNGGMLKLTGPDGGKFLTIGRTPGSVMDFTLFHKNGKAAFAIATDEKSTLVGVHGTGNAALLLNGTDTESSLQVLDQDGKLRVALSSGSDIISPGFVLADEEGNDLIVISNNTKREPFITLAHADDQISAAIRATDMGGGVILSNPLGMMRVFMTVHNNDGGFIEFNYAGTRSIAVGSYETGGNITVFGEDGETPLAIFPEKDEDEQD